MQLCVSIQGIAMKGIKMQIIDVPINDLKPSEYNPRDMTEDEKLNIRLSIERFDLVEPIVVNNAPERMNIIIGGHQRWLVAKELGRETMPVVYHAIADIEKEKELNLRLNKNTGHWDWEKLSINFDEEMKFGVGFTEIELAKWNPESSESSPGGEDTPQTMAMIKIKCPIDKQDEVRDAVETALQSFDGVEVVKRNEYAK